MSKGMNPAMENILLKKRIAFLENAIVLRENAAVNMSKDASMMACRDIFHMGPDRAEKFSRAFDSYMLGMLKMCADETNSTTDGKGKTDLSIEWTREKIDAEIREIVGEKNFQPFEVRYAWNDVTALLQTPVGKVRLEKIDE